MNDTNQSIKSPAIERLSWVTLPRKSKVSWVRWWGRLICLGSSREIHVYWGWWQWKARIRDESSGARPPDSYFPIVFRHYYVRGTGFYLHALYGLMSIATSCISIVVVLIVCFGLSCILCYLWKIYTRRVPPSKQPALRSSTDSRSHKSPSLTVHHDVQVTIRPTPSPQTRHYLSSETLAYIDDTPFLGGSPWSRLEQSFSALRPSPIQCRYSTSHLDTIGHYRNVNGQPIPFNVPFIRSQSDTTLSPSARMSEDQTRRAQEIPDEMRMLKISVPSLSAYPFIKPVVSFDSERELAEFNQMSLIDSHRTRTIWTMSVNKTLESVPMPVLIKEREKFE